MDPALANAAWWYWFWELIGTISFFAVVVALAIEFGAARLAAPYKEKLDSAREERIASANERAANAELALEQFKAPRRLDADIFVKELAGKPAWPVVEILYVDAGDCLSLATQIAGALHQAQWPTRVPKPIRGVNPSTEFPAEYMPVAISYGGQTIGVSVVAKQVFEGPSPQQSLIFALAKALSSQSANGGRDSSMRDGTLRIVVAPKQ